MDPIEMPNTPSQESEKKDTRIGEMFFQYRDYTPIPLLLLAFIFADASAFSAFIGTLIVLFGELIRIVSVSYIGSISRTRKNQTGGALVTSGPYGMVRNPLYVGNFFMVLGIVIFTGVLWFSIFALICFIIQYHFIVAYEEELLAQKFPIAFEEYQQSVPRWIPREWGKIQEIDFANLDLAAALKSEKRTLAAAFLVLILLAAISL